MTKLYHPDTHPNDAFAEEMMRKINEAGAVFRKHLNEQNSNSANNARPENSPGAGAQPNDDVPPPPTGNTTMEKLLRDVWQKYKDADRKWRESWPDATQAFNKQKQLQQKYDEQKSICDKSPTIENLQRLMQMFAELSKAQMDYNTARLTVKRLLLERDMWLKEYKHELVDYQKIKNHSGRE